MTTISDVPRAINSGERILHIGPAKTGTSMLQGTFHRQRAEIEALGVTYLHPPHGKQARMAASEIALGKPIAGAKQRGHWERFVTQVQSCEFDRALASSETFAHAQAEAVRTIADVFGRDKLHIAITLRPLADMLASSWQQYVQEISATSYDGWLNRVLVEDPDGAQHFPTFWRRNRVDLIAQRWAEVLGPERVHVISIASPDRSFVLRAFEQLLGLPDQIMQPSETLNASLPHPMVELIRQFNQQYKSGKDWSEDEHIHLIRRGAIKLLEAHPERLGPPSPIITPSWAIDTANSRMQSIVDNLDGRGFDLIGDFNALSTVVPRGPEQPSPTEIPIDAAATFMWALWRSARELYGEPQFSFASEDSNPPKRKRIGLKRNPRGAGR